MQISDFLQIVQTHKAWCFDIEHDPTIPFYHKDFHLWGCGFSTEGISWYEKDLDKVSEICNALFPLEIDAIAYNGKYDLKCLKRLNLIDDYPKQFVDPMVGINLLNENLMPNQLGLKSIVKLKYDHEMADFKKSSKFGKDSPEFKIYANEDVKWTYKLWSDIQSKLEDQGLMPLFRKILMEAAKVFTDQELIGIKWDIPEAERLLKGFDDVSEKLTKEIYEAIGGEINLNSGKELAQRLFDELGYSTEGLTYLPKSDRFSVDVNAMNKLAKKYEVCNKIRLNRTAIKMAGTYLHPITQRAKEDPNERIHPSVWLVSKTGRTRQDNPNFQNIPVYLDEYFEDLKIRGAIIPKEGCKFLVWDLSQIELRLAAHVSMDGEFLKAFRDWKCTVCNSNGSEVTKILHICPNCGCIENEKILKDPSIKGFWHGLDLHQITTDSISVLKGDRQAGKMCNFALIYCATQWRMNYEYPDFSIAQWEDIINEFMEKYKGIYKWHLKMKVLLHETAVCTDIFGRKRRILPADIRRNEKNALNMFVNFPVQSSACALIENSYAKIREAFIESGEWFKKVWPVNFVHDELVLEVTDDFIEGSQSIVRHCMEDLIPLKVPVRTDLKIADRWSEAK